MQDVLIDANVVISFLHSRIPQQQRQAAVLFESAARQELRLLLHQHVLAETVYVLLNVYGQAATNVAAIIADLLRLPGTQRVDRLIDSRLFSLWPTAIMDFGDAMVAAVAAEEGCLVATFDKKLRRALERQQIRCWAWN